MYIDLIISPLPAKAEGDYSFRFCPVKGPFPNKKYCKIMQNFKKSFLPPYFDSQNGTKNTIPKTP